MEALLDTHALLWWLSGDPAQRASETLPSGATPLDAAASAGAVDVVRVLLNHAGNPNSTGRNGPTPLEVASLKGLDVIAGMLLDPGVQVNQVNTGSGATALYAAAAFGKGDVEKLLLRRRADPDLCGNGHTTAYRAALENGYDEVAAQIQRQGGSKKCKKEGNRVE